MKKLPRLRILSALVVAVSLVAVLTTPVLAQPVFSPLSGAVTIDGNPAPVGTTVAVFVGTEATPRITITTTVEGYYEAVVEGTAADVGLDLTFEVNDEPAVSDPESPTFASWEPQVVNLALFIDEQPPAVSTLAATGVSHDRATLRGNLTNLGDYTEVRVRFQWGPSAAYGNNTPWQTRTGTGSFNALITGLTPDTTYHFRAQVETVAPSNTVTVNGVDMTFTTDEEEPIVGGTAHPVNTLTIVAPWIALAAVVAVAAVFARRRLTQG